MQTSNTSLLLKRRYSYISLKKRESLVQEVLHEHKSLSKTAKRLNIRLSTAKLILKKYKLHGKFFMKKTQQRRPAHPKNKPQDQENHRRQKQPLTEEQGNAAPEHNIQAQFVENMAEGANQCNFFLCFPVGPPFPEWCGWNIMPVAYLQ